MPDIIVLYTLPDKKKILTRGSIVNCVRIQFEQLYPIKELAAVQLFEYTLFNFYYFALRTSPGVRNFFEWCSRGDISLRITFCRVIDIRALKADITAN
jgi:hypothetical protein